jgi:hypothetical protein
LWIDAKGEEHSASIFRAILALKCEEHSASIFRAILALKCEEHSASIFRAILTLKCEEHAASIFKVVVIHIKVTSILNIGGKCTFGIAVSAYKTARCHNLDDHGLNLRN